MKRCPECTHVKISILFLKRLLITSCAIVSLLKQSIVILMISRGSLIDWFRTLIRKRQRAHMKGDKVQANVYRNKVNRAAVSLRK